MPPLKYTRLEFNTATKGLGVKLTGGVGDENKFFGIFVKRIIPGGVLAACKKANVGDQIINVNGIDLRKATLNRAVNILRQATASGHLVMTICSDSSAKSDYSNFVRLSETKAEKKLWQSFNGFSSMHVDDVPPFNLAIEDPHLSGVKRLHDLEQTIEFRKSSAGIGFRVHSVTCSTSHACCKQVSLLRVAAVSPGGDAAEDGRLRVGDFLTKINAYDVLKYNTDQIHSLLLREKLRHESKFQLTYIPAAASPSLVAEALHSARKLCRPLQEDKKTSSLMQNGILRRIKIRRESSLTSVTSRVSSTKSSLSSRKRLSLDGSEMIEMDKLYSSLDYLGYSLTDEQYRNVNEELEPDEHDAVRYQDFVDAVFKVCDIQMPSKSDAITRDLSDSDSSSSSKSDSDNSSSAKSLSATIATQTTGWKLEDSNQDLDALRNRIDELELKNRNLIHNLNALNEERAQDGGRHDTAVKLLEQQMTKMKLNYDQTVKLLESEVELLQSSEMSLAQLDSETETEKQLSLAECECRKLHEIRMALDSNVQSLLAFLDKIVHTDIQSFVQNNNSHEAIRTFEDLTREAEKLSAKTRKSLGQEDMPYGWEEASLSDGRVYYIDHHTHTTSWTDPRKLIAGVQCNDSNYVEAKRSSSPSNYLRDLHEPSSSDSTPVLPPKMDVQL